MRPKGTLGREEAERISVGSVERECSLHIFPFTARDRDEIIVADALIRSTRAGVT